MALDYELARMFAKMTNDQGSRVSEATVQGTVKEYAGGMYVQLDGSDLLTPVSSTTGMKDGDRVNVMIKDHSATVTGNTTAPSATKDDTDIIQGQLDDTIDQISEFEIVIAGKVDTEVLNAQIARIDNLTADNVVIKESLSATEANIKDLQAENVTISGQLDAFEADIDNLHANMLTAEAADLKYATIENLEATDAKIYNLEGTYAEFEQTVTEKLTATDASIENLEATKLSAEEADLKYANIDFANIGKAAIENFFSKSGMIGDLVVGDGTITGHLVGVTISGDLIEGNTIKADKLVVLGEDGLYYKLNVNAETVSGQQTEYNSINGSIITANTITAEKINVNDLVAFDATIGGFKITDSSLYSGVKESIDNTTRGIYMDDTGQIVFGDQSNYLKYFHDETDDTWKLQISAGSIKLGASQKDIETVIDETVTDKVSNEVSDVASDISTEYYKSTSATSLTGGSWSSTAPTWSEGSYIWTRTKTTKKDGTSTYSDAVCITGNTGDKGDPGDSGTSVTIKSTVTEYQTSNNGTTPPTGTWSTTIPSVSAGSYLWTRVKVTYSDDTVTTSYSVARQGEDGAPGDDGTSVTVSTTSVSYAVSTSGTTIPESGWQSTVPTVAQGSYLWTKNTVTYSDGKSTTAYSVARQGSDGSNGTDGVGIDSTVITYQASSSQTETPTGEWLSTIPELSVNAPYLWTRTVITYTDETSTTSYSVSSTINGIEVVDTVSGEGYVSIGENGGKKPYEIVIYGKTRQNLWVNPSGTNNGSTITENDDGSLTVNDASVGSFMIVSEQIYTLKPGGTYTASVDKAVPISAFGFFVQSYNGTAWTTISNTIGISTNTRTFEVPDGSVACRCGFQDADTSADSSGTYRVMLNEGSEAEPWCPPGLNSIESLDLGFGAFDYGEWEIGTFAESTGAGSSYEGIKLDTYTNRIRTVSLIPIEKLKSFDSKPGDINVGVTYFDSDKTYLGVSTYQGFDTYPKIAPSNAAYFGIIVRYTDDRVLSSLTGDEMKLLGQYATANDYSSSNLQGNVLSSLKDGTRDELHIYRDGSRKIIKRTHRVTVDGNSVSFANVYSDGSPAYYYAGYILPESLSVDPDDRLNTIFCDQLVVGYMSTGEYHGCCSASGNGLIARLSSAHDTVGEFNTFAQSYPITYVYKLAEEQEITLDPIELPELNAESATVVLDTGVQGLYPDLDLTYWTKFGAQIADADSSANKAQQDIDNLEVGATNLALITDRTQTYQIVGANTWFTNADTTNHGTAETGLHGPITSDLGLRLLPEGGEFTVSYDYTITGVAKSFEFATNLKSTESSYTIFGHTTTIPTGTSSGHISITAEPTQAQMNFGEGFLFNGTNATNNPDASLTISNFKFEKGNKETTWSQAPEELASGEYVDSIEEAISTDIADLQEVVTTAELNIDSINATISSLVTDENGTSLMEQTSDGWTFNIGAIKSTLNKATDDIQEIHGNIDDANALINTVNQTVSGMSKKMAYVNIGTDDENNPCILLGETSSPFKLRITNTSIDFMEGSDKIAYITNKQLYIQSSVVTDEMRVGSLDDSGIFEGFVWKKRSNGNMGLRWEG